MARKRDEENAAHEQTPLLANASAASNPHDAAPIADEDLAGSAPDGHGGDEDENARRRLDSAYGSPYLGGVSPRRFWLIFGCTLLNYFVATFDSTLMASSHPVITSYFNASNSASWLSTAFLITATSFQPLFGRLSDTFGRRAPYIFSFVVLAAATAWCALAQSIGSFIAARAVCGLGASGCLAMGAILTNDLVPIEIRGKFQGFINLFYGAGMACGAAFGGALCERIGWRWAFGMQVPLICLILVLVYFITPTTLGPRLAETSGQTAWQSMKDFDNAGSLSLITFVSMLVLGLNLGGNVLPWTHPIVIVALAVAAISGALLIYVENRAARPVMPLYLLFTAPRGNLMFSNFFSNVAYHTTLFNIPLFFQAVKLESATTSGFRIGPSFIFSTTLAVATGFVINATGRMKSLIVIGNALSLVGCILLCFLQPSFSAWVGTGFLIPVSSGQAFNFPATSVAVLAVSTQEEQAVTTATLLLFRSLGIVMGVALSSLILQNSLKAYLWATVTGPRKAEIITMVRQSVHSILSLGEKHQTEVREAYAKSLILTFVFAAASYVIVNLLVLPAKIPRLDVKKRRDKMARDEEDSEASDL